MNKATLVIMAAGIGSRFGGGIKQLEPVGPGGELIMDYSIYDALQAGFDKIVFVIRRDLERDFKEVIGERIEKLVAVEYAYQEKEDLPSGFAGCFPDRQKPWGTGQAILCCRGLVTTPFLVINADDYYGSDAYKQAFNYLTTHAGMTDNNLHHLCMVGFVLENTLSDNGGVTRGICHVNDKGKLDNIVETHNIVKYEDGAGVKNSEGEMIPIGLDSVVSMNMWGMYPDFFEVLEKGFVEFLTECGGEPKSEYLLPTYIGGLLKKGETEVHMLKSEDDWFGVTFKEDKESVVESVRRLVRDGLYPEYLYEKH